MDSYGLRFFSIRMWQCFLCWWEIVGVLTLWAKGGNGYFCWFDLLTCRFLGQRAREGEDEAMYFLYTKIVLCGIRTVLMSYDSFHVIISLTLLLTLAFHSRKPLHISTSSVNLIFTYALVRLFVSILGYSVS